MSLLERLEAHLGEVMESSVWKVIIFFLAIAFWIYLSINSPTAPSAP